MPLFDAHTHWNGTWNADRHNPADWLAVWDRHGIARGAVCPLVGLLRDDQLAADNRDVVAACARSGGRMLPFCSVNPSAGPDAVAELGRLVKDLPLAGVKFHPWLQGASLSTPTMDELCELAGGHRLPVLVHDGTPPFSLPSQVALLARRHPRTTFLLGHCGSSSIGARPSIPCASPRTFGDACAVRTRRR